MCSQNKGNDMPVLGIIFMILVLFLIKMGIIMLGWWLFMEPMFGLPAITLMQAFGLNLLFNVNTLKAEFNK